MKRTINESQLRDIIRESIKSVLNEREYDNQWIVYNRAKELLERMGYNVWREYGNPYVITVSIKGREDLSRIETVLRRELGVKDLIDMSVRHDSNMFGGDERAKIFLPAITHTGFYNPEDKSDVIS